MIAVLPLPFINVASANTPDFSPILVPKVKPMMPSLSDVEPLIFRRIYFGLIKQKTTTRSMRLADGHILSNVIVSEIGGADGLREVLLKTIGELSPADLAQEKLVKDQMATNIKEKMKSFGTDKYTAGYGSYGPNVASNISRQFSVIISSHADGWKNQFDLVKNRASAPLCSSVF